MQRKAARLLGLTVLLWAGMGLPGLALAGEPNRAGLVVQFGDGRTESRCVSFEEGEIRGADLLNRSGLDLSVDASSGMGITVCQIEGEGCAYPAEPCFCQCMGGDECNYWNYLYRDPGATEWTYSALGAVLRKVSPGSVEAWVWGSGSAPPAGEWTFEAICPPPTPPPTDTPEPATVVPATVTVAATEAQTHAPEPTAAPTATPLPPGPAPSSALVSEPNLLDYWPFALTVLGLVLIGAIVRRRRS